MAFMRSFVFLFVGVSALDLALDDQDDVREEEESFGEVEATTDDVAEIWSNKKVKDPCCIPYRTDYGSSSTPAVDSRGKTYSLPVEGECFKGFDFHWTSPKNVQTGFSRSEKDGEKKVSFKECVNDPEECVPDFLSAEQHLLEAAASVQVNGVCCENTGALSRGIGNVAAYMTGGRGKVEHCAAFGSKGSQWLVRLEEMVKENKKAVKDGNEEPYKDLHFLKADEAFKKIDRSNLIPDDKALELAKQTALELAKKKKEAEAEKAAEDKKAKDVRENGAAKTIQEGWRKSKDKQASDEAEKSLAAAQVAAEKKLSDSLREKELAAKAGGVFAKQVENKDA